LKERIAYQYYEKTNVIINELKNINIKVFVVVIDNSVELPPPTLLDNNQIDINFEENKEFDSSEFEKSDKIEPRPEEYENLITNEDLDEMSDSDSLQEKFEILANEIEESIDANEEEKNEILSSAIQDIIYLAIDFSAK
ncbi:5575_t:CDS:2, partial [Racocetra persica]